MQRNLDTPAPDTLRQNSVIINTQVPHKHQPDSFVKLKDAIFIFIGHWRWFVLSLCLALGAAYYYLQLTPSVYRSTASVMIKADDKGGAATEELMTQLGLHSPSVNITNEIMSLRTLASTREVIDRLNLSVECYHPGAFHDNLAYGINLPVDIRFIDQDDTDYATFNLSLRADSTVTLSDMSLNGHPFDGTLSMRLGQTVKTPMGTLSVNPSPYYVGGKTDRLNVTRRSMRETVTDFNRQISALQRDQKASIIDLAVEDVSRTRGEDILTTLIAVYNENWVRDRNRITSSTTDFIRERLAIIEGELGNVDSDISDYKSRNLMTDVGAAGGIALDQMTTSENEGREIDNRLYMTRYLRNYLTDGLHEKEQLPANSGIGNPSIETQISAYNSLLLQRNNHLSVSSEQNPLVMDIDQKLQTMKQSIVGSLDNELTMLNTQRSAVSNVRSQAVGRLAANPQQAKYLLSVERQQKVKESLYLFLLQKREENELSQAFTAYNTRVIEHPSSNPVPVKPNIPVVIGLAGLAGLALPALILLLIESFNTSVRGRKDIEQLQAPFVGEIPQAQTKSKKKKGSVLRDKNGNEITDTESVLVVKEKGRNVMNEAFRVVRTNLEFILGFDEGHHVVMLTSMNPGSGKTFITANLSNALAIKGKKVVAVDLDLRRGSLSKYAGSPTTGVSNYLSGQVPDWHQTVCRVDSVDIIPVGTIPPNPTELLFNPRFTRFIEALRNEYDYVFIDCPPVEIVADAAIISRYADMTLFVVRAHLLDRAFLPDIEKWYEERRFPNLSIILNGTHDEFSHYGNTRYGHHRYGYHYGHYGEYGYAEE